MFKQMLDPAQFGTIPLLSVDLPSCWDADIGPPTQPVADPNDPDAPPPVPIPVMYPDSLVRIPPSLSGLRSSLYRAQPRCKLTCGKTLNRMEASTARPLLPSEYASPAHSLGIRPTCPDLLTRPP